MGERRRKRAVVVRWRPAQMRTLWHNQYVSGPDHAVPRARKGDLRVFLQRERAATHVCVAVIEPASVVAMHHGHCFVPREAGDEHSQPALVLVQRCLRALAAHEQVLVRVVLIAPQLQQVRGQARR